ncbi:MAG: aromatic ring-hydroxylating dioxygenase subunit alpha [Cyanobacteriota bacterium]|nr:aromatic ring-hydroxylating dioxygenase subunit alpha [Cyanobacteriota bacterium]
MVEPLLEDWHAVASLEHFPENAVRAFSLLGRNLVLWRQGDRLMAWDDRCPHRGAKLSGGRVEGETLICPYHGLTYDFSGQCVAVPGHPGLTAPPQMCASTYLTRERYGLFWVNLSQDAAATAEIPPFREWDDPSYRKFLCGPYSYRASGLLAIENFLDISHFPFIHDGFLGDRHRPEIGEYQVTTDEEGIALNNVRVWQPNPDGTGSGGYVTYHYRVWRPLTTSFVKESGDDRRLAIFFTVTPIAHEACLGWMWIAMNYGLELPEAELRQFQDTVVRQDIPIVESLQPPRLPLDLRLQVHLPGDRASLAYRRWLAKLGVKFGTVSQVGQSPA